MITRPTPEAPEAPSSRGATVQPSNPSPPAGASPEEKDLYWLKHCYQGAKQKQLTLRAVLTGGILGMFMAMSNLYTMLKLGWTFGVAITACVLSFVFWNAMRFLSSGRLSQMSLLESNCMASTASAAGYSTGALVGTAVGALLLVQGHHLPWQTLAGWVFFSAGLGVFLAIPMKRQMINHEQLPFPTGTAAAETLRSLYSRGKDAMHKAYGLIAALAAGLIVGILRSYGTMVELLSNTRWRLNWLERLQSWLRIPEDIPFSGILNPLSRGHMAGLSFEPSVLLIGAGMIAGTRVSLSMLAGSVLLYYVVAPAMLAHDLAHSGLPGFVPAFTVSDAGNFNPLRWGLWGGTAMMVFASLTTFTLDWKAVAGAFTWLRRRPIGSSQNDQLASIEVPNSWLIFGLVPFSLGMVLVLWLAFQVSIPLGIVAVLLSAVVSLVCCRVTGETDTTPLGPMGKVTQLFYAILPGSAGNTMINLITAGATSGAGMSSADLLTDLKSGYLLGANPRKQFWAQFIGVFFGVVAIVPGWYLMVPTKEALERFNPPAVNMWKAVADLLTQGIRMLPTSAVWLIVIGAFIGVLLPLCGHLFPRARPWLPSVMGLGLSWVIVFQNSLAFAIGASVVWLGKRFASSTTEKFSVPVASGFIAGESLIAALIAIACTLVGILATR